MSSLARGTYARMSVLRLTAIVEKGEKMKTLQVPTAILNWLLVLLTLFLVAEVQADDNKPNVVFILADNVGYGDLGSYGGGELRGAPTPRLDQMAREGLRLTQYLVEPACTPSRAALMTGQYSIRNGLSLIDRRLALHVAPARVHDGGAVQERGVYHSHFWKVALGRRAAEPADRAWLRRVLRNPP